MSEKIGGKFVYTAEEAAAILAKVSPEDLARGDAMLAQFKKDRAAAGPAPEGTSPGFGGRFSDDLNGTEWEGWTRDQKTGQWYDKDGRPRDL